MSDEQKITTDTHKIAEENANFIEGFGDLLEGLINCSGDMLPGQSDMFRDAFEGTKTSIEEVVEELRLGKHDEAIGRVKPPALWDLEKKGYNRAVEKLGNGASEHKIKDA